MESKKILVVGDNHTGHRGGLTPPEFWVSEEFCERIGANWRNIQKTGWEFFCAATRGKWDGMIHLGDAIDGKGRANGARELLTADRDEQIAWAVPCFNRIDTDNIIETTKKILDTYNPKYLWLGSSLDGIGEVHDRIRG